MPGANATLEVLHEEGVVGIVRAGDPETARRQSRAVLAAGLRVVEVSLTTPGALDVIAELAPTAGEAVVGAGTVMTAREAEDAVAAGSQILVTPALVPEVVEVAVRRDVAVVPGCLTPSEMTAAMRLGATAVKIFPAHLWSPAALSGMLQALPDLRCVPTGGVSPSNAAGWIAAGALALGVGSALTAAADPAPVVRDLRRQVAEARSGR